MGGCKVLVSLVTSTLPTAHLCSPPQLQRVVPEVCRAQLSAPGVTGIKDTSSAFFFVFHLLGLLIVSTVWGCTSQLDPLWHEHPAHPRSSWQSNAAFWAWECFLGLADLRLPLKTLPGCFL